MRILLPKVLFWGITTAAKHTSIFVASYSGTVTTLSLKDSNGSHGLSMVAKTNDCGISPTWLELDQGSDLMFCLNEGIGASNGSITSFQLGSNGALIKLHTLETLAGPVMSTIYATPSHPEQHFLAVAHYEGSAVTSFIWDSSLRRLNHLQTFSYHLSCPGPVPDRQDAPHPHGAIIDPTGRFVVVPDLGMDRIHIFKICPATGHLQAQRPLMVTPGSGPRHAVFWSPRGENRSHTDTILYLVSELDNTLSAFQVNYTLQGVQFTMFYKHSTYGEGSIPSGSKASGISISPEHDRIVVSNRGDDTFGKDNDSFAVFSCATDDGSHHTNVSFIGLFPAYGSFPREFDISGDQNQISVALQNSHEVALVEWDQKSKHPGKLLSSKVLDGEIVAAVWGP